jgi:hypothetical protein
MVDCGMTGGNQEACICYPNQIPFGGTENTTTLTGKNTPKYHAACLNFTSYF